jgi:hypothetical protein
MIKRNTRIIANWVLKLKIKNYVYLNKHFNIKFIPNTTGRGPIIAIFFLFLSDYFYVIQYTPSSTS